MRWTVPASLPCYAGWDFHIDPGTFDLPAEPVAAALRAYIDQRRIYYARFPKSGIGYRSHLGDIAALDWLLGEAERSDLILWDREQDHVWHLASELVYTGQWSRAWCPACQAEHRPGSGRVEKWAYGSGLAAEGGRRYVCPTGHTLYAIMEWNS